jgi:hypothetical protein
VFFSGSLLVPLVVWFVNDRRVNVIAGTVVLSLALFFASPVGGYAMTQGILLGLWFVTSLLFVGTFWMNRTRWIYPRDHFIFAWTSGFLAMMLVVMDWVAARYYCLVAPGAVFVAVRLCELRWGLSAERYLKPIFGAALIFTGLLAYVDYRQAEPSRLLTAELRQQGFSRGARHFYLGDSFTMSYLREEGWIPCFPETDLQPGDRIVAKEITMPLVWFHRRPLELREVARFDYPSHLPLKVMDYQGSAGFYASVWGALPFTFSSGPWERFHLIEVVGIKKS